MSRLKIAFLAVFVLFAVGWAGCISEEDETEVWEEYCLSARDCASVSGQMFSMTECRLEYKESCERHESVGCAQPYESYLWCVIDLPCSAWGNVSQSCAAQIDALNICVN